MKYTFYAYEYIFLHKPLTKKETNKWKTGDIFQLNTICL
jgi:hypothetical protein